MLLRVIAVLELDVAVKLEIDQFGNFDKLVDGKHVHGKGGDVRSTALELLEDRNVVFHGIWLGTQHLVRLFDGIIALNRCATQMSEMNVKLGVDDNHEKVSVVRVRVLHASMKSRCVKRQSNYKSKKKIQF